MKEAGGPRTRVARTIKAPRKDVYRAFLDADTLAAWLPPGNMSGHVHVFEPRAGGQFRMSLRYRDANDTRGKSAADTDTFRGRFAQLVPDERIVWIVEFESSDDAFAGEMSVITTLADTAGGTEITMTCENIPQGISPEDNAMGTRASLQKLATLARTGLTDAQARLLHPGVARRLFRRTRRRYFLAHKDPGDREWNAFVEGNARGGGALVFGRVTYEMMASFWPTPMATQNMPAVAERMNALPKFVFSRTLKSASWANTTLVNGDLAADMRKLKAASGPDLTILGSGSIVAQLAEDKLIDVFQIVMCPLVLDGGKKLFDGIGSPLSLTLTESRGFRNGSVMLTYAPA